MKPLTKTINLRFPTCWDELTTRQMEQLSKLYARRMPIAYFTVHAFMLLAGLKLLRTYSVNSDDELVYYVRRRGWRYRLMCESIPYTHQEMTYWARNAMGFLFNECDRSGFPYPRLRLRGKTFKGPSTLCQDFTWRQYKWATDFLTLYRDELNILEEMVDNDARRDELTKQQRLVQSARNQFLATIFTPLQQCENPKTRRMEPVYEFSTDQVGRYANHFNGVSDTRFRCIMIFWEGVGSYLKSTFPHIFKSQNNSETVDPLKAEAQITETLKRRSNLSTDEIYDEPYTHILESLERMSIECEEIERQRRKA